MKEEALGLLKKFYTKGNDNIPEEKRHRYKKLKVQEEVNTKGKKEEICFKIVEKEEKDLEVE